MAGTDPVAELKASIANAAKKQAAANDVAEAQEWQGIINQNLAALRELED